MGGALAWSPGGSSCARFNVRKCVQICALVHPNIGPFTWEM